MTFNILPLEEGFARDKVSCQLSFFDSSLRTSQALSKQEVESRRHSCVASRLQYGFRTHLGRRRTVVPFGL